MRRGKGDDQWDGDDFYLDSLWKVKGKWKKSKRKGWAAVGEEKETKMEGREERKAAGQKGNKERIKGIEKYKKEKEIKEKEGKGKRKEIEGK